MGYFNFYFFMKKAFLVLVSLFVLGAGCRSSMHEKKEVTPTSTVPVVELPTAPERIIGNLVMGTTTQRWKEYRDPKYGFTIKIPTTNTIKVAPRVNGQGLPLELPEGNVVEAEATVSAGTTQLLWFAIFQKPHADLENYVKSAVDDSRKQEATATPGTLYRRMFFSTTSINGAPAYLVQYRYINGQSSAQQIYLQDKNHVYLFVYLDRACTDKTQPAATCPTFNQGDMAERILSTFRIKK